MSECRERDEALIGPWERETTAREHDAASATISVDASFSEYLNRTNSYSIAGCLLVATNEAPGQLPRLGGESKDPCKSSTS